LLSALAPDKIEAVGKAGGQGSVAMDLRQLRSFMGVAQRNGFRRGALSLNIAQPAVSRHIKRLEASLGVKLFHRTSGGGVTLTDAGQLLMRHTEELFQKLSQIRDELSAISQHSEAVRIGAPSSIGEILFAPLAHRVREHAPEIHLSFTESSCRLLGLVKSGHVDLAVLSCTRELNKAEWTCQKLVGERVYLVGSPDALGNLQSIDAEQVTAMPLILTPLPNAQHQYLCDVAKQYGRKLNVVAEAESMIGLMAMVDRGLGLAVLPFSAASLVSHAHPVSACEISGFYSWRTLIRRADCVLSPAGRKAWEMIITEMQTLSAAGIFGPPVESEQPPYGALPVFAGSNHETQKTVLPARQ
jgi:LysR family nitrogen assimilation transcriptional regulator